MDSPPALSLCIVTYQAAAFLQKCLESLRQFPPLVPHEIIVVDNASTDNTLAILETEFPQVKLIKNSSNLGYAASMNQAMKLAQGRYIAQLNPDTMVLEGSFDRLIDFMDQHPEVGICGPKVLNFDGSMQKSCRRGESTPLAVIAQFTGLARLFPHNPRLAQYTMSYRDEDETHAVAGVSGSCMLIRREVIEQIGYLDERFFAYQEDADYCFRARQAGWLVYYIPTAKIIHYGGLGGSHVHPYRSMWEWHRSYWNYYRKNLAINYPAWFNGIYYMLMLAKLGLAGLGELVGLGRFSRNRVKSKNL
ncbi:MAG: glycosyltransferase family 2 protein [Anaerolineales bacterium]